MHEKQVLITRLIQKYVHANYFGYRSKTFQREHVVVAYT